MKNIWFGYWLKNWFLIYKISYSIVISGIRSYFKNHQFKGQSEIPKNAGIIYAVNHQNAFLDPIVIAGKTKEPIYFLTRADIFKKPFVAKVLSKLYMLPIYRKRDGVNTVKLNEKTFDNCYDILREKGNLIIFPEGNHHFKKSLRPFKKGAARIALGAAEKYNYNIPLYIQPLAIDYENHFSMNGDLLLNVGKSIDISEFHKTHQKDPVEAINKLSSTVYKELDSIMINIQDLENYESIYFLLHKIPLEGNLNSVAEKFQQRKNRLNNINRLKKNNTDEYSNLIVKANNVKCYCKDENLKPFLFEKNKKSIFSLLVISFLTIILAPIHLAGLLTNYIPYKAPIWFINKKIKDKHFHGSLKMALGTVLFYIYWTLITGVAIKFQGLLFGLYAIITLPFIALFNFSYWNFVIKIICYWKLLILEKEKKFSHIEKDYEIIKTLIN